ncbi:MAG TPA: cupin domain-containing protein [Thermoanaerobaculia bacterium]|nr:cupin domain-containing protein [Thermoanaerobaculia bacterium]
MNTMTSRLARAIAVFAVVAMAVGMVAYAQQAPAVKRNVVLKTDMSIPDREGVMAWVELPPGSAEGKHTHPAEVFAFVLEGTISLENEGNPTATLKAGDVFHVLPGKVHQAINNGSVTAKLAAVFVAEKGKPLTTQVK